MALYCRLVYQAEPSIRVSLPAARATGGKARCDADHFHQPGEVSIWVTLTACAAASAMHAAAEPGDAAPLEPLTALSLGQWATWSGHRCRSGFVANTAAAESAVSFDFRVIPWSVYREDRAAAKRSNHNLRLGSYYAIMDRTDADREQEQGESVLVLEP